jgi:hypothetical protein
MDLASRIAAGTLVGAFAMAGLALNDALGLGHRSSGLRIVAVLVAGPALGALAARTVVQQARDCVTWLLALAGLTGLVAVLFSGSWLEESYRTSGLAQLIEPAPPPAPYVYPRRGMMGFLFLASSLCATAATYYRRE